MTGRLEVIHGSMFGGKTEHVIARLRQEQARGKTVKAFKHAIDNRYDPEHLVTHREDRFEAVRVSDAESIVDHCEGVDVVAIDEGHFFKMALVPVVRQLRDRGVTVIVAGISHDAWGRPFEPMPQLAQVADEEVLCQAPCRVCGDPAPFTQRTTAVNTLHMVGGLDDYEPRCAKHFTPLPDPPEER
ncbi:MAG: thymidine kinase [Phycisphaerae bacterium]|nr:thymidine kinase [Phycisphaerae bacterium]